MGSWQMVLWQPRWVHAETDGLCYQKITADERPIGREKRIAFTDVREIEELEYGEFVLQCGKRDYTFKAPDERKCQVCLSSGTCACAIWRVAPALCDYRPATQPLTRVRTCRSMRAGHRAQLAPAAGAMESVAAERVARARGEEEEER